MDFGGARPTVELSCKYADFIEHNFGSLVSHCELCGDQRSLDISVITGSDYIPCHSGHWSDQIITKSSESCNDLVWPVTTMTRYSLTQL